MKRRNLRPWMFAVLDCHSCARSSFSSWAFWLHSPWTRGGTTERVLRSVRRTELRARDSTANRNQLSELIGHQERVASTSRRLAQRSDVGPLPSDSARLLFSSVFSSRRFEPLLSSYIGIIETGGLSRPEDRELRAALAGFAPATGVRHSEDFADSLYLDLISDFPDAIGFVFEGAQVPTPLSGLLADPRLRTSLNLRATAEAEVGRRYGFLLERANRILSLLESLDRVSARGNPIRQTAHSKTVMPMVVVMVQGIGRDPKTGASVVLLREVDGERLLPIWVGPGEAAAIAIGLNNVQRDRPLTHDLAATLVTSLGGRVTAVRIHRCENKMYFAEVVLERDGEVIAVDSRPSDSIAIALRTGADILVADHLLRPLAPTEGPQAVPT